MNGATAQIPSLSSGETDRCEYLTGEKNTSATAKVNTRG